MNKNIIKKIGKITTVVALLIMNLLCLGNSIYAASFNEINTYSIGDCGTLLTYEGAPVQAIYIETYQNGSCYPAYCMDRTKPGAEKGDYYVTTQNTLQDVKLWRIIINGFPYKSLDELGVDNGWEAFTATKQAVYCYLHGKRIEYFGSVGTEAGDRTLNALKMILTNAENSTETKVSSTITINRISSKWEQDPIEKEYVSKTYQATAQAEMGKYRVQLTRANATDMGGIKITDENNNERNEFYPNERFKVLVPMADMKENGAFDLKVDAKVKTKPVYDGKTQKPGTQDYAITTNPYEDGEGIITEEYTKNETKLIIMKKDQDSSDMMEGVEFELLDKDEKPAYVDLKTDENGRIEIKNLIPGTYYLKETITKDGYEEYPELIKVELELNQEMTIIVNNKKQEKPEIEKKTAEKEVKLTTVKEEKTTTEAVEKEQTTIVKTLPVAGM